MTSSLDSSVSWSQLKDLHDKLARRFAHECNKGVSVRPHLFVFGLDEKGNLLKVAETPGPVMQAFFGQGTEGKNAFAQLVNDLLQPGSEAHQVFVASMAFEPRVLAFIAEAWALEHSARQPDALLAGSQSLADHPLRKEVIQITLYTPLESVTTIHWIEAQPHRHCEVSEFPSPEDSTHYTGRFSRQHRGAVH